MDCDIYLCILFTNVSCRVVERYAQLNNKPALMRAYKVHVPSVLFVICVVVGFFFVLMVV